MTSKTSMPLEVLRRDLGHQGMCDADIEDFMESLQYQWSTAFGIMQIGEAVKKLSSELLERHRDIPCPR